MKLSKMLKINLLRVPQEGKTFAFELDSDYFSIIIDQEEILGGDVRAIVEIKPVSHHFIARLSVSGEVDVECDRCLADLTLKVENNSELVVKFGTQEQIETQPDEDIVYVDEDGIFDVSWLLFELIELSLPMVRRHQEGGCNPTMEMLLRAYLCANSADEE